jgi:hypothetical protein
MISVERVAAKATVTQQQASTLAYVLWIAAMCGLNSEIKLHDLLLLCVSTVGQKSEDTS